MSDDIVGRLWEWASGADEQGVQAVSDGLTFAAAEIERLRVELQNAYDLTKTLTAERDEARRQRDQARRTLCKVLVMTRPSGSTQDQHGFAKEMGWDCFPQEDGK
jgi:hypothetical protein